MGSMQRRWLLLAVILTAPSGCDNVTWGGTEVHLRSPSDPAEGPTLDPSDARTGEALSADFPTGPILLAGTRNGDTISLVTVGEVRGDALGALPTEAEFTHARLAPGTELVLFSGGARVGRLTVRETTVDDRFCTPHAVVKGIAELVPAASEARRFLALADSGATRRRYTPYRAYDDDYEQRVASLALASAAIPQVGAPWPPSLLESRADMQSFRLPEAGGASLVATFLHSDRLSVGQPGTNAYALFVIGSPGPGGYQSDYMWYRRASDDGKGAPRYFDHLDWNDDGVSEVLLDVFGAEHRWFASLSKRNGRWVRSFQDPCGGPDS